MMFLAEIDSRDLGFGKNRILFQVKQSNKNAMNYLNATIQFILDGGLEITQQIGDNAPLEQLQFENLESFPTSRYLEVGARFTLDGRKFEIVSITVCLDKMIPLDQELRHKEIPFIVNTLCYVKRLG